MFKLNKLTTLNTIIFKSKCGEKFLLINDFNWYTSPFSLCNLVPHNNFFFNNAQKYFFKKIFESNIIYFRKIFYVGKSYKTITKLKYINFKFNRSHITYIFFNKLIRFKKIKKNAYKFKFLFFKDIIYFNNYLNDIRKLNVFTSRGIKISKNIKFKKKGKISTYTM